MDFRYPIGPYEAEHPIAKQDRGDLLAQMAEIPGRLRAEVEDLSFSQLDTPYRPGGWTVRQVVHHLPDSQLNWYVRTRLALTEEEPTIKPYAEERWAVLHDAVAGPIEPSLQLLAALHQRWVLLFESLIRADWDRRFIHPEMGAMTLATMFPLLVWHGRHHTAHITELRKRMGW